MPRTVKKKKATTKKKSTSKGRVIIYPKVDAKLFVNPEPITPTQAKEFLGWLEETPEEKFGKDFLLKNKAGVKIRCTNNITNRPLYTGIVKNLIQEHHRQRWEMNGEPVIIGKTGLILNGQHCLVSLILAYEEWLANPEKCPDWKSEPVMEKLVVLGIDESDTVVNTMDTCKPRTLTDVIYRSNFFSGKSDNLKRCKVCENAVNQLRHRTGANRHVFAPRKTHAESLDFIARHPKIIECVNYICEENDEHGSVSRNLSLGYASTLLYLMGSSKTKPGPYYQEDEPSEKLLTWSNWGKATDFWVLLAGNSEVTKSIHVVRDRIIKTAGDVMPDVACAIIVNAWSCYVGGDEITTKAIKPNYFTDKDDIRHLADDPTVGGIDIGSSSEIDTVREIKSEKPEKTSESEKTTTKSTPTKKTSTKKKKSTKKKSSKPTVGSRKGKAWAEGDTAWVSESAMEPYFATLLKDPYKTEHEDGVMRVHVKAKDGEWEVKVTDLHLKKPE